MKYVIGFDLAVEVVLVEVGAEVLHQQEVEDFHHMEEVVALQVQMVQTVVLVQPEQLDRVEVLGDQHRLPPLQHWLLQLLRPLLL